MSRDALKMVRAPLPRNHHNTLDLSSPSAHTCLAPLKQDIISHRWIAKEGRHFTAEDAEGGRRVLSQCHLRPLRLPSASSAVNLS